MSDVIEYEPDPARITAHLSREQAQAVVTMIRERDAEIDRQAAVIAGLRSVVGVIADVEAEWIELISVHRKAHHRLGKFGSRVLLGRDPDGNLIWAERVPR